MVQYLALCLALLLVAVSPLVQTRAEAGTRHVDLRRPPGSHFTGAHKVSAAGDVNGDGLADLLVAEGDYRDRYDSVPGGPRPSEGRVYVVFGRPGPLRANLDEDDWDGFVIEGARAGDQASESVGLGDVNGDGLDDVVVGAPGADNNNRSSSGSAYVVFGKQDEESVSLAELNVPSMSTAGFRIDGPSERAYTGQDVAALPDINGDGLNEIVVGAPGAGATYVVFGKESLDSVDLLWFELNLQDGAGFVIDTPIPEATSLYSVEHAGDVNADGVADIVIGVVARVTRPGRAFVVFGEPEPSRTDVRDLGTKGFVVEGVRGDGLGYSVAGIGDANGDGRDDLALGARNHNAEPGRVYVVFGSGSSRQVSVSRLGNRGFTIKAKRLKDATGGSVAAAGDQNGDGLDDVILGAERSRNRHRRLSGSAYVVYGKRSLRPVRLRYLGAKGFRIDGAEGAATECGRDFCLGDLAGSSVAGIGDFNGDGLPDLAVGAIFGARSDIGRAYILHR